MSISDKIIYSNSYYKTFYTLKFFLLIFPISIIIGNSAVNINSFFVIITYFIVFFLKKNIFKEYKKIFYIFIFFIILCFFNIYFSNYKNFSLISTLGILRYFIVMMAFLYCLENDKKFINLFSKFLFFILIFVSLDTLLQYFTGQDLFGYENNTSHGKRLTGPFGDEYLVGSYLTKFVFISGIFLINKDKKYHLILYFLFLFLIVILSNERMATILFIFSFFIFSFFTNYFNYKKKITLIFILIFFTSSLLLLNKDLKKHFISSTFDQIGITQNNLVKNELPHYSFWDSQWGAHFLTAFEIFKNQPIYGSGIKSFRFECGKDKYKNINSAEFKARCNTHPHNFYLEILSETGIIIFLPFVFLNLIIIYRLIVAFYSQKEIRNLILMVFCSYVIMFFPIQTSGSFFSTWNGIFYWIVLSYIIYIIRINNKNKI